MPHAYPKLRYVYRALFFLAVVFGLLLILSALVYFSILPSALLFLGWLVSPIPFFSPAWYLLTFMTVLLFGIATGTVIHRQQLIAEKQEHLTKEVNNSKQFIELQQDLIETKIKMIITVLTNLKEQVNKTEPQNTDVLQKIKKLISEVELIQKEARKEKNISDNWINDEKQFHLVQEKLNSLLESVRQAIANIFPKKADMMALQSKVDGIGYQNTTENTSQAPVTTTPYSGPTLFRNTVTRDHQENTNLLSQNCIYK